MVEAPNTEKQTAHYIEEFLGLFCYLARTSKREFYSIAPMIAAWGQRGLSVRTCTFSVLGDAFSVLAGMQKWLVNVIELSEERVGALGSYLRVGVNNADLKRLRWDDRRWR